jgi:lipopolysaccharide transport system ATP-binding protein
MSYTAIEVSNLSKRYYIGRKHEQYECFTDRIRSALYTPYHRVKQLLHGDAAAASDLEQELWVFRDLSFRIQHGEVVGLIGRNGAGKSTLLKLLSRITEPTGGTITVRGKIGALLEVGVGFHHELTGRENIYLKGALLGMPQSEIDCKFDEIVSFAEIDAFLDTPIKHYSSGMKTRLGFAVVAHLEPDILLVDEVLAVGDHRFQRRCLEKMQDIRQRGSTIIFVSHDMSAVARLCDRAILIEAGQVVDDGPADQIISTYLQSQTGRQAQQAWPDLEEAPGDDTVRLRAARIRTEDGEIADAIDIRRPFALEMEYDILKPNMKCIPHFNISNENAILLFITFDTDRTWQRQARPVGRYISRAWIPGNYLAEGVHFVGVQMTSLEPLTTRFHKREALAFQVIDSMTGDTARGAFAGAMGGVVRPLLTWETDYCTTSSPLIDTVAAGQQR